ncbi:MAG TPA: fibronectin type III domain-containing protein [Terracidiphilus sp.]|nr:fibronectin type III domain-containing protein [Terracidiphilus sp.]
MNAILKRAWAAALLAAGISAAGCGFPGAPLPPSLNLPQPVKDLSAVRAGDQVQLQWTMPSHNTDKTLVKGNVAVRVCRSEDAARECNTAGTVQFAPGAPGAFHETLPAALATGSPRVLTYFVELNNSRGRSAGLSNGAPVLAGQAPPAVSGLNAEMAKDGVILRWTPLSSSHKSAQTAVRLQRTLLTPAPAKPQKGPLATPGEPLVQNLRVPPGSQPGIALDKNIRFGEIYEYRAQRVETETSDGQTLELAGELSLPVRIHAVVAFPPAAPAGLEAVATPAHDNVPPSIDLSWQPDAETDVAGYIVYRRESGEQQWQRISPAQPVVGPAFHDAQVDPGHTYIYAVSAVGTGGLESARSAEARETVPNQ